MTSIVTKTTAALALAVAALFLIAAKPAFAEKVLGQGTFVGKSNHATSGTAVLVETDQGVRIRFGADFELDGAPDPWVGFGSKGKYVEATQLAKLEAMAGAQSFAVPAATGVSKYDEIYVWCSKFGVPLGVAKIR